MTTIKTKLSSQNYGVAIEVDFIRFDSRAFGVKLGGGSWNLLPHMRHYHRAFVQVNGKTLYAAAYSEDPDPDPAGLVFYLLPGAELIPELIPEPAQ